MVLRGWSWVAILALPSCTPESVYHDVFLDHDVAVTSPALTPGSSGMGSVADACPEGAKEGCETQTWTVTSIEYDEHAGTDFPRITAASASGSTFMLTAGLATGRVTYYVNVSESCDGCAQRRVTASVTISEPIQPTPDSGLGPAIDLCANAAMLGPGTHAGNTSSYADDVTPPGDCTNGFSAFGPDAFYRYDLTAGQMLSATVTPVGWDAMLYLLDGCEASSCTAGVDAAGVDGAETTSFTATADGMYHVVVDSPSLSAKGAFSLNVTVQ